MKTIKLIIVATIFTTLLGSCKSQLCPGYGDLSQYDDQTIEQLA
jgi:hypothetical protein